MRDTSFVPNGHGERASSSAARRGCKALALLTSYAVALLFAGPGHAERLDCSGTKRSKEQVSSQSIKPGDRPDRELVQFVRVDTVSSKNPEFDKTDMTVYGHLDLVGGTGIDIGYAAYSLAGGEKLWAKWEGTHYLAKGGDDWEVPYLGVYRFIAGTGKYKAIRGGGHYKGKVTAAKGTEEEFVCEAEY